MSNGSIIELVAKGKLDEDIVDINNKSPYFNYDINKKNKYTKGDFLFYPEGKVNWGNTVRFNIERKGDLLYGLYLVIKLPKLSITNINTPIQQDEYDPDSIYRVKYTDYIGNTLIEKASLYINGQLIDEQYGDYLQNYIDLYISDWNRKVMLGRDDVLNQPSLKIEPEYIYVPLKFWFCTDNHKPLPVIALQYSDIYLDIKFRKFNECYSVLEKRNGNLYHSSFVHNEMPIEDAHLQANFYFLDLEERKQMAMKEYEIMITQSQLKSATFYNSISLEIDFNHVVKDLFFTVQPIEHKQVGEFFNYTSKLNYPPTEINIPPNKFELYNLEPQRHLLTRARLLLNGSERIQWRDAKYFYYMQNHENYRNTLESYVYVYSFNINPRDESNFSGCNFSRIDNAQLQIEVKPNQFIIDNTNSPPLRYPSYSQYELKCYATNFNILVIKNGLASLRYN